MIEKDRSMKTLENDLFLRACRREKTERTPIWMMRQAGRYLPEYRAVRAKSDFITMCKTPELATEVTIQPIDLIGVDAAIIFSDILVIPEAMGLELEMIEKVGPVFHNPIKDKNDVAKLKNIDPTVELKYVLDAVSLTKKELNGRVPLIGFSGSPWTLLTYMIEGGSSKNFAKVKRMMYDDPETTHKILDMLAGIIAKYLSAKIEAGANAVQIFDTWGGILSKDDYIEFSLGYCEKIIASIKRNDEPVILFSKGVHTCWDELANSGADVIGIDWVADIGEVKKNIGNKVALQGNLDPTALYASPESIRQKAESIMQKVGDGTGHIFNLGHGLLPDLSPDNVKALTDYVKSTSHKFHS